MRAATAYYSHRLIPGDVDPVWQESANASDLQNHSPDDKRSGLYDLATLTADGCSPRALSYGTRSVAVQLFWQVRHRYVIVRC